MQVSEVSSQSVRPVEKREKEEIKRVEKKEDEKGLQEAKVSAMKAEGKANEVNVEA